MPFLVRGDDTDIFELWDACWDALERLPGSAFATAAVHAEAARIINSYRGVTEGRGIERIDERVQAAYRLLAAGSDEQLNRFRLALGGARSVLRETSKLPS